MRADDADSRHRGRSVDVRSRVFSTNDRGGETEFQDVAAAAEVLFQFPQRLVLLVTDPSERKIEFGSDFRDRRSAHPELDDSILTRAQHGPACRFQNLAELDPVALALVQVGRRCAASV